MTESHEVSEKTQTDTQGQETNPLHSACYPHPCPVEGPPDRTTARSLDPRAMAAVTDAPNTLQCPQCSEQFEDPHLLPCFHTLCGRCLTQQLHADGFPCPTCNTMVIKPGGAADVFPVDVYVEKQILQSKDDVGPVCDACQEADVTHKCVECGQFMCKRCCQVHGRLSATRSHTLLALSSSGGSCPAELLVKERYCRTHAREHLRFYCADCRAVICRDCKLTAHQTHSAEDLPPVSQQMLNSMTTASDLCQSELRPRLQEALQEAERQQETFTATASSLLAQVKGRAADIKSFVDRHVEDVERQVSKESDDLGAVLDAMRSTLASLELLRQHVSHVQQAGCPADVVGMFLHVRKFFGGAGPSSANRSFRPGLKPEHLHQQGGFLFGGGVGLGVSEPVDEWGQRFDVFTQEKWKRVLQMANSPQASDPQTPVFGGIVVNNHPRHVHPAYQASIVQHLGTVQSVPDPCVPCHPSVGRLRFGMPSQPCQGTCASSYSYPEFLGNVPGRSGPRPSVLAQNIQKDLDTINNNLMIK